MKKVLMSLSLVAFLGLTMTSCLKNDSTPAPQVQDPALERPVIDSFNNAMGYTMMEKTDSSRIIYVDQSSGQLNFVNIVTPDLMYQIVTPGEMAQGNVDVTDMSLGGTHVGNTTVYNLITDSTQYVSVEYKGTLLNGTVFDSTKTGEPKIMLLPNLLTSWRAVLSKIGKGGHIRFATPSAYAYGPNSTGIIPVNSPLFFDVTLVGAIKNSYQP